MTNTNDNPTSLASDDANTDVNDDRPTSVANDNGGQTWQEERFNQSYPESARTEGEGNPDEGTPPDAPDQGLPEA